MRDAALAVAAAVLVLGFLGYAIVSMSGKVTDIGPTGKIVAKNFTPQPEEQVTIGRGGLNERKIDGAYTFEVYVDSEKKSYTVWVDKTVYEAKQVGENFHFLRPPPPP